MTLLRAFQVGGVITPLRMVGLQQSCPAVMLVTKLTVRLASRHCRYREPYHADSATVFMQTVGLKGQSQLSISLELR